jgi:hypothetical protein
MQDSTVTPNQVAAGQNGRASPDDPSVEGAASNDRDHWHRQGFGHSRSTAVAGAIAGIGASAAT